MKTTFLLLAFIFSLITCSAQNLVPNPSFEEYDTCPNWENQVKYAIGWKSCGNSTPEYYNACSVNFSVPSNQAGYQMAVNGNAYCGFYSFSWAGVTNYREYIGCKLTNTLVFGKKYFVSFKVSSSNSYCGTNNLGALFSTYPYYYYSLDTNTIVNFAHVNSEYIIIDSLNWSIVSGSFVADSTYEYITLGNFFTDINTITTISNCIAYYYIDDICVSDDSLTCPTSINVQENYLPNEFEIYPILVHNQLTIKHNFQNKYKILLYNDKGCLMFEKQSNNNYTELNMNTFANGIYFLKIQSSSSIITKKIILTK